MTVKRGGQSYLSEHPLHVAIPWHSKIDPEGFSFPGERKSTNVFTFVPAPPLFALFCGVLGLYGVPGLGFLFLLGGVSELGETPF